MSGKGRPPLPADEVRSYRTAARFTESTGRRLDILAHKYGGSKTEFLEFLINKAWRDTRRR